VTFFAINKIKALFVIFLLVCLTIPVTADAKKSLPVSTRKIGYNVKSDSLYCSFGYKDVFNNTVIKKLKSGLPTRIVVKIIVENENGKPVAIYARTSVIVFDLWEENFIVTNKDINGTTTLKVSTIENVIHAAGVLKKVKLANLIPSGKYRLKTTIEANPVSEKMVKNIQRWISKPSGNMGTDKTSTNYFGAFIGYFVDRNIGSADKTILFISQWFNL
jgi:hypothetical protein